MSRDIRKLFQKNVRGKLSEQGNGGFFEQEDKKCETEAGEILCEARENRLKRADKRAEKEQNLCIRDRVKLFFGRL